MFTENSNQANANKTKPFSVNTIRLANFKITSQIILSLLKMWTHDNSHTQLVMYIGTATEENDFVIKVRLEILLLDTCTRKQNCKVDFFIVHTCITIQMFINRYGSSICLIEL